MFRKIYEVDNLLWFGKGYIVFKVLLKKLKEIDFKGNIKNKVLFVCRDFNVKGIKRN